jgi:GTPase SAR1 family protein
MTNIFISSTFKDLKDHRERVSSVIRKMGHEDIAMEYNGAEDKRPLDKCLEDVAICDVYIGIFAWRYGYNPPGHDMSITELEYRKARECNKECLIFLLKEDAPWQMNLVEKENLIKIEALRNELSDNHLPAFFSTIEELGEIVAEAIYKNVPSVISPKGQELFVEQYYNALLKQYKILDLDALTQPEKADFMEIQLRSIFVEQDVRENPPPIEIPKELLDKLIEDEKIKEEDLPEGITLEDIKKAKEAYFAKPASAVLDVITNPKNRYIVILGDPGSGKSTLSRYIVLSLITKENEKLQKAFNDYLPLIIELRDYAAECTNKNCNTFLKYLDLLGESRGHGLTEGALDSYLKNNGKSIIIFDGLDEIFDPNQRANIEKQIVGFTNNYPKARVLVTSRIVGYKRSTFTNADFSTYTLQDFRKPQIDAFIDKWYNIALINNPDEARARKERINRSLDESASIRQLAGNPLLLTIMAIINKHQELPRERWRLYDHASSVLIHHWDWERRIKEWNIKIEYVGKDDKEELLRRVAFKMQSATKGLAGNYIHADTLQNEFEKYFKERYQKNPADAKLAARVLLDQLRERNFILCRYGSNLYGFIHRTFLEYFCASSFVWKFNIKHEFDIDDLKNIFQEHWGDKSWHEVLRLICGMIDEKFAEILICYLMRESPPVKSDIFVTIKTYPEIFSSFMFNKRNLYSISRDNNLMDYFIFTWKSSRIILAIKCLGELKNIETIRETSSELLEKTWEVLGKRSYYVIEDEDLITTFKYVGKRWVGREILKDWIQIFARDLKNKEGFFIHPFYRRRTNYIGAFIGYVGAGDMDIKKSVELLLKNDDFISKNIALTALAFGWHDEADTLKLLQDYALKDANEFIRETAISLIGQEWQGDINNLKILQNCALTDNAYSVRNSAFQVIATSWSNNPNALPFLCDLAKSASDFNMRLSAVRQIGGAWKKDITALELLKDSAANDTYSGVRKIAVSLLGELWKENPTVISLLRQRASKEQNPAIQTIIHKILTQKDA